MIERSEMLLECRAVSKHFGGLVAVHQVDFNVHRGELVGLIGPNGAGKTTLFNLISGMQRATAGRIFFQGQEITSLKPHQICRLGISRTFQLVRPFLGMTALENVKVAAVYGRPAPLSRAEAMERAHELLAVVDLMDKEQVLARRLNIGQRKRLELARALATEPELLLLDELAAGLTPGEVEELASIIRRINAQQGVAVVMVEHLMRVVMGICHRLVVLEYGQKIADGPAEEVARDPQVVEAYLGQGISLDQEA